MSNKHFNRLVKMYENLLLIKFSSNIKISLGKSEISILAKSDFHSANSLHGSIFLKC